MAFRYFLRFRANSRKIIIAILLSVSLSCNICLLLLQKSHLQNNDTTITMIRRARNIDDDNTTPIMQLTGTGRRYNNRESVDKNSNNNNNSDDNINHNDNNNHSNNKNNNNRNKDIDIQKVLTNRINKNLSKSKDQTISENSESEYVSDEFKEFLKRPIINPHNFRYLINHVDACRKHDIRYIIAVPSHPGNFENRQKVRENNGGRFTRNRRNKAKLLFFLGKFKDTSDQITKQNSVVQENEKYGDIIQSEFLDTYRNITKKAALILKWSSSYCKDSTFVLRMDDDLKVDLYEMTKAMEEYQKQALLLPPPQPLPSSKSSSSSSSLLSTNNLPTVTTSSSVLSSPLSTDSKNIILQQRPTQQLLAADDTKNSSLSSSSSSSLNNTSSSSVKATDTRNRHFMLGTLVKDWYPVRDKNTKYYTSYKEYPKGKKLPNFLLGGAYGYSVATGRRLFEAYRRLKIYWLDDVFITAMCASKVGVSIHHSPAFVFKHWTW